MGWANGNQRVVGGRRTGLFEEYATGPPGLSSGGVDVARNQVRVTVHVATPELTEELKRRFGDAVAVEGLLEPVG